MYCAPRSDLLSLKGCEGRSRQRFVRTFFAAEVLIRKLPVQKIRAEYRWSAEKAKEAFGTTQAVERFATEGKAALVKRCMVVSAVIDSIGICKVPALSLIETFDLEAEAALINAFAGLTVTSEDLFLIGERIINIERLFNLRYNWGEPVDMIPKKFLEEEVEEGPARGKTVSLKPMLRDFYRIMGWDDHGIPGPEKLRTLNLEN